MDISSTTKIKLDTRQAKRDIRVLGRAKRRSERRKHGAAVKSARKSKIVRGGGRFTRFVGKSAGIAAGYTAMSRLTRAGPEGADPWGEIMTPVHAALRQALDEQTGGSARAKIAAREETKAAWATSIAHSETIPAALRQFHRTEFSLREGEELGRNILRQDPRFRGPSLEELLAQAIPGYFRLLGKSFDYIYEALTK